ncbi:MAG TPA: SsrA-binding protein SmpB [Spirochaetota bacterium]|nr:SsrA-binding protein SmpB [Spirochaetota bacterium]HOL57050.1 SsrA-binding protein SmpB [Spirochaetota bacterium]HPP04649.1 SsrA-binding protein SmpB [Spirochaetota bacterium]
MEKKDIEKTIIYNKKANFEYIFLDKFESGIQLKGTEVKSLREGKCSIGEAYIIEQGNEIFIKNMNISHFKHGNINNHDPLRLRKLLLHKKEIEKIKRAIKEKGTTVVPIRLYFKGSLVKVEIAIAKGKKLYDKRETIKERETKKHIAREMKTYK